MKSLLLTPVLLITLTGCTTVHTVDVADPTIDIAGPSSTWFLVTTVKESQGYVRNVERTPDSTRWTDASGRRRAVASSQIKTIESVDQLDARRHRPAGFAEINAHAATRKAQVVLADGASYDALHLQLARDTTGWSDPGTGAPYQIATPSIAAVRFRDGKRGTLRGLAAGIFAGALTGMMLGFASGDDPEDQWFAFTAGEKAMFGGLALGPLGGLVGAILGSSSKAEFRFNRVMLSDATSLASPVVAPIVSQQPVADVPEVARPLARTPRRAGSRWTVSTIGAGVLGGATPGLEKAMTASGFGKSSACFFSCGSGDRIDHPHSSGRAGWLLDVHREVRKSGKMDGTMGFLISRTRGESFGYDGSTYLFITQHVTTFAPIVSLQANPALRLGLGPAWHRVGMQRTDAAEGDVRHQTRLGFVADLAVTFPARTRFYLDLRAQYRYVGSVEVGPYEEHRFGHDSVFPASRVGCSHGVLGAGVGMRL